MNIKTTSEFYKEFKDKSKVISNCWKELIDPESEIEYLGWNATPISSKIWKQEEVLKTINNKFPFKGVGLIKMPTNYNYNWHVDDNRGCGINMLLEHEESHSFFREIGYQNNYNFNASFIELKYKPDTFYVFNTQRSHCVYNFGKPRYLFTCELYQDVNELSYETVCEWMKENKLLK